jgi:signal transduction histidine kinase
MCTPSSRLFGRLFLLLVLVGGADAAHAQKTHEGYLLHETRQELYYFRAIEDSLVYIRKGTDSAGTTFELPTSIVLGLSQQVGALSPPDSGAPSERFELGYKGNELRVNLSQSVNVLVMAGLFILIFWVPLLVYFLHRLRREKLKQAELAESRHRLSEDRELERRKLAQELHDGPIQDLHSVRMRLNLGSQGEPWSSEAIQDDLLHVIRELRSISEDLRPPALAPFGLGAALQTYLDRFGQRHPAIRIEGHIEQDGQQLPEQTRLALFRICQEALSNAAHHSQARNVQVRFQLDTRRCSLEIIDDGVGFTLPGTWMELAQQGHYGLLGMSERAESIGAQLEVSSRPGVGTRIQVVKPLQPERAAPLQRRWEIPA